MCPYSARLGTVALVRTENALRQGLRDFRGEWKDRKTPNRLLYTGLMICAFVEPDICAYSNTLIFPRKRALLLDPTWLYAANVLVHGMCLPILNKTCKMYSNQKKFINRSHYARSNKI